jgi:hypothetical protein
MHAPPAIDVAVGRSIVQLLAKAATRAEVFLSGPLARLPCESIGRQLDDAVKMKATMAD